MQSHVFKSLLLLSFLQETSPSVFCVTLQYISSFKKKKGEYVKMAKVDRTQYYKDYYQRNRDHILQKQHDYYTNNKQKEAERKRTWYQQKKKRLEDLEDLVQKYEYAVNYLQGQVAELEDQLDSKNN